MRQHPASVIVYGPQGSGKTRNKKAIADFFGLANVIDDWNGVDPFSAFDSLVLTSDVEAAEDSAKGRSVTAVSVGHVLDAISRRRDPRSVLLESVPLGPQVPRSVYEAEGFKFPTTAPDILKRAAKHMEDRAAARDQPGGERSMKRTVDAFNALTGHALSERDGWMFMAVLKAARACNTPTGLADDYEDGAAYFGLAGEAAQR